MNNKEVQEPKTLGDCRRIFEEMGFMKPNSPLDDSYFPNARRLVELNLELETLRNQLKEADKELTDCQEDRDEYQRKYQRKLEEIEIFRNQIKRVEEAIERDKYDALLFGEISTVKRLNKIFSHIQGKEGKP